MKRILIGAVCYGVLATVLLGLAYGKQEFRHPSKYKFFYRYEDKEGLSHLKALFPPVLVGQRIPMNANPNNLKPLSRGHVLTCSQFRRVHSVVRVSTGENVVVHELVLDCGKAGLFIINGFNFRD